MSSNEPPLVPLTVDIINKIQAASDLQEFRLEKQLGEGTYGDVTKRTHLQTGVPVALKRILTQSEEDGLPATALREISIMRKMDHENVIKLLTVLPGNDRSLMLVCECMEFNLSHLIKAQNTPGLPIGIVRNLAQQLLRGIVAVHQKRVLHRDLKPQNILLDRSFNLKIGDFGLARTCGVPVPGYTTDVVTRWYRPPELLLGDTQYTPAVDLWSIGCILVEMICGRAVFPADEEDKQLEKVVSTLGKPTLDEWPEWVTLPNAEKLHDQHFPRRSVGEFVPKLREFPEALDLVDRLLAYNPKTRLTATAALQHAFFRAGLRMD
jgi:serine/threonine protein kinase